MAYINDNPITAKKLVNAGIATVM
ncbi:hypothetical protein [Nitratiruptor tergarcus]|nr:hypothetical protein [Nitratiruptor tergarcus]